MGDLPDFYMQTVSEAVEASSVKHGADSAKAASPTGGDIYYATDTKVLYFCASDGAWTGIDAATLVEGILTLYANMLGGAFRITNIADPTSAQDAATKAYADVIDAKLDDVSQAQPTRALDTIYQNSTKIRVITIDTGLEESEDVSLQVGSSSPPTTVVSRPSVVTGTIDIVVPLTAIILPSYYYRLANTGAGTPVILRWTEWDLH